MSILDRTNDWSESTVFDARHRLDDAQVFASVYIFGDRALRGCVMLLVTQKDMVEQRTVRRKERACHFQGLCVPELRLVSLAGDVEILEARDLLLQLDDESDLRANTEIADAEETHRLEEGKSI